MDLWSTSGAGTQLVMELAVLAFEIIAIVGIIEWLRQRREYRLLKGARKRLGDEVLRYMSALVAHLAVLALCKDSHIWNKYQVRSLELAKPIFRHIDGAVSRHFMNVQLINLFEIARQNVESVIDSIDSPVAAIEGEPVSLRNHDAGLNAFNLLVRIHDEIMETIYPGDNMKKLDWLGVERVAVTTGYLDAKRVEQ